jgi:hypothetical protein
MKLGDAFLMAVPPSYQTPHLFFVISDPQKHNGNFVIVNITGDEFLAGKECILEVGDHPWITKKSFVAFGEALEITPASKTKLQALFTAKKITAQPGLKPEVLARIIEAGKKSKAIETGLKKYL